MTDRDDFAGSTFGPRGKRPPPSRRRVARLLLRGIALVYVVAFLSLVVQIEGLYGSEGILPAGQYLRWIGDRAGSDAWTRHPTLFWALGTGDAMLVGVCVAGAASAFAMMCGVLPTVTAAACWLLYFSLFQIGRVFLGFQWDILLLEAGFLAIFVAPPRVAANVAYDPEPSFVAIWAYRWLLFRLMFASGMVKLLSDDPAWWNLTALEYHYWTQPLPTWTSWYAAQLPPLVHRASTLAMFVIELVLPWFVFGPRALRMVAFGGFVLLQLLIAATGNYTFFNLLTVVLCASLVDDDAMDGVRARLRAARGVVALWPEEERRLSLRHAIRDAVFAMVLLPIAVSGGALMLARFGRADLIPRPVAALVQVLEPWNLTSSYGLFSVMTTHRPEVILEGTEDGVSWHEYRFRWKPGDVTRRPRFAEPHQPRLDWQMWFAALGDWRRNAWLVELQERLLEASPPVLALLADDPFDGRRPKQVRALLYEYRFTDSKTRAESGAWWSRTLVGPYSPPMPMR